MEAPAWCPVTGWHRHRHHAGPSPSATTRHEGWGLLPGHQWGPRPGHQWGLSHGHGQPRQWHSGAMTEQWDVIIVGGGAAGLSAALTLGRASRRVLVVDAGEPRNRFASHMHGVLGHEGLDPADLLRRGREEASVYGVVFVSDLVVGIDEGDRGLSVQLAGGETIFARAVIVASGITDELPDVDGLAEHWGTGVLHCPYCHGWEVTGSAARGTGHVGDLHTPGGTGAPVEPTAHLLHLGVRRTRPRGAAALPGPWCGTRRHRGGGGPARRRPVRGRASGRWQ
jgi:choline dehydrogenase-like flavoprotein